MSENGEEHPGGQGRMLHALKTAKEFKATGVPVNIFFHRHRRPMAQRFRSRGQISLHGTTDRYLTKCATPWLGLVISVLLHVSALARGTGGLASRSWVSLATITLSLRSLPRATSRLFFKTKIVENE